MIRYELILYDNELFIKYSIMRCPPLQSYSRKSKQISARCHNFVKIAALFIPRVMNIPFLLCFLAKETKVFFEGIVYTQRLVQAEHYLGLCAPFGVSFILTTSFFLFSSITPLF